MTVAGGNNLVPQRATTAPISPVPVQGKKSVGTVVSNVFNKGNLPFTQKNTSGTWGSGGLLSDIGDILNTPQYAATSLISGQKSVGQGVKERFSPSQAMKIEGTVPGIAADVLLDPLNLAAGIGLVGKGAKALGYVDKAADLARISKLGTLKIAGKGIEKLFGTTAAKIGQKISGVARNVLEPLAKSEKSIDTATDIVKGAGKVAENIPEAQKVVKPLGQLAKEAIENKFPVFTPIIKKAESLMETLPERYLSEKDVLVGRIGGREAKALEIGKTLTQGLTKAEQNIVGKLINGEKIADASEKLTSIAALGRRSIDSLSNELAQELAKGGFGADRAEMADVILKNIGVYAPKEYLKFALNPTSFADLMLRGKKSKLITTFLKKRKDLSPEAIEALGGLAPIGYSTAKRMGQVGRSIETSKFFRFVDKAFASVKKVEGYTRLSDSEKLGVLANKYVPKMIADDINYISKVSPNTLYQKLLGMWKMGKVILNPATQARNFMSNLILMDLGDFPVLSPNGIKYFRDAIEAYTKKGELFKQAQRVGLFRGTYFGSEVKQLLEAFDEVPETTSLLKKGLGVFSNLPQKGMKGMQNLYSTIEETSKLAMFKWRLSQGDNAVDAARYAKKWLFDYENVPDVIKKVRNMPFGFPFITFAYKATPRIAETILTKPTKFTKYGKIFKNVEEMQPGKRAEEQGILPDYIKGGQYVRLPFQDKEGNSLYFDMNYILPWGMFGQTNNELIPGLSWPSDPLTTIVQGMTSGTNPFTQMPIWKETDTSDEKRIKVGNFVYQTLMPPIAPEIPLTGIKGGYSYEKVKNALFGKPDRYGTLKKLPATMLDVGFGLKTVPISPEREIPKRVGEYNRRVDEIKANIRSLARDQSITNEAERQKKIDEQIKKLENEAALFNAKLNPVE